MSSPRAAGAAAKADAGRADDTQVRGMNERIEQPGMH